MKLWAEIGALKLSLYLKDKVKEELFDRYSSFLRKDVTKALILERLRVCNAVHSEPGARLVALCKDNLIAITCLELAFLEYMLPFANSAFECVTCRCSGGVTLELAAKIALGQPDISGYSGKIADAFETVRRILVKDKTEELLYCGFHVDLQLAAYLEGKDYLNCEKGLLYTYFSRKEELPPSILFQEQIHGLAQQLTDIGVGRRDRKQWKATEVPVICVCGEKNSGRRFFIKQVAVRLGWNLFFLDIKVVFSLEKTERNYLLDHLLRDAELFRSCICLYGLDELSGFDKAELTKAASIKLEFLKDVLSNLADRPLFLTSREVTELPEELSNPVVKTALTVCGAGDNLKLWNEFSALYLQKPVFPFPEAAERLRLSAGQIEQIIKSIRYWTPGSYGAGDVITACYELLDRKSPDKMQNSVYSFTWEDLKLPEETGRQLHSLCDHVTYKRKLLEEWGLKRSFAYGSCVSALFAGPPGTGKTMAAHVIANALDMELLKIDLSQIMDKYIGETEKRLEECFRRAEQTSRILFFDEADVLFGKRSAIQDSKDRYANNEVSYILQRMEEFDGVILLASNLQKNIDPAFTRRLRYIVGFPMPDTACRKEIWEALLGGKLPHGELDLNFLAERFELSGAVIKNIVWNSAVLAAGEDSIVTMCHIIRSLAAELHKMGQLVIREEFAAYSVYL